MHELETLRFPFDGFRRPSVRGIVRFSQEDRMLCSYRYYVRPSGAGSRSIRAAAIKPDDGPPPIVAKASEPSATDPAHVVLARQYAW